MNDPMLQSMPPKFKQFCLIGDKFILVAVPKCASTSLTQWFFRQHGEEYDAKDLWSQTKNHPRRGHLKKKEGGGVLVDEWPVLPVILPHRDPVQRLLSAFEGMRKSGREPLTIDERIEMITESPACRINPHYRPQRWWADMVIQECKGECVRANVAKLHAETGWLSRSLGMPYVPLEHANASGRAPRHLSIQQDITVRQWDATEGLKL